MPTSDPSPREGSAGRVSSQTLSRADQATVLRNDGRRQALIDPAVLEDLEEQLQSPDVAHRFVCDYAALWEQRHRRLTTALEEQDHAAALDAVISLKTSSAMVGGKRLAGIAEKLQSLIQTGDLHSGQALLSVVADSGRATVNELNLRYILKNR